MESPERDVDGKEFCVMLLVAWAENRLMFNVIREDSAKRVYEVVIRK